MCAFPLSGVGILLVKCCTWLVNQISLYTLLYRNYNNWLKVKLFDFSKLIVTKLLTDSVTFDSSVWK